MNRKPFTVLVRIALKPGRASEFLALLNDVFDAMKVEDTFVNATALRSADDPDTIMLCETWFGPRRLHVGTTEASLSRTVRGASTGNSSRASRAVVL